MLSRQKAESHHGETAASPSTTGIIAHHALGGTQMIFFGLILDVMRNQSTVKTCSLESI